MTAGMKSSEFWAVVVATAVNAWLASRGTTVDVMVAVTSPVLMYVGGRSHIKAKAAKNGS